MLIDLVHLTKDGIDSTKDDIDSLISEDNFKKNFYSLSIDGIYLYVPNAVNKVCNHAHLSPRLTT